MAALVRRASDRGGPEPSMATPPMSNLPLLLLGFATGVGVLQLQAALPRWPFGIMAAALFALVVATRAARRSAARLRDPRPAAADRRRGALARLRLGGWRATERMADALPPQWEGVDVVVVGVVDDLPQASDRGVRFTLAVESTSTPDAVVPRRLGLAWYAQWQKGGSPDPVPDVAAGERWRLTVRLKRPHGNANPHGFDVEAWLLENNLRATGYVRRDPTQRAPRRLRGPTGRLRPARPRARARPHPGRAAGRAASRRDRGAGDRRPARDPARRSGRSSTAPASPISSAFPGCT